MSSGAITSTLGPCERPLAIVFPPCLPFLNPRYRLNHAKTVDITPKVEDSEDEDDSETESSTEEEETWLDDEDLDWEKGTDISKDVEWDADEKSDEKPSD